MAGRRWLAAVFGGALLAHGAMAAVTPPTPASVDLGPLGTWQVSGGADGVGYVLTGAGNQANGGLLGTDKSSGLVFQNGIVQAAKTTGLVQALIQAGVNNSLVLGARPISPSIHTYSTGPFRQFAITLAPNEHFSVSAGQLASLEGYEGTFDWQNPTVLATSMYLVENSSSVGVSATYTAGKLSGTALFSDGFNTNVYNYLQLIGSYAFNESNTLTLFGATNLGRTGLGAHFYGSSLLPYRETTVGTLGVANFVNSSVAGAFHTFTAGDLTVVPEVQYVWARADRAVGITKYTANLGAALFANYQFGRSPYSFGGWAEYFASNGDAAWFLNAGSQGYGIAAGPTWAQGHFFARGSAGWLHLTRIGIPGTQGYGSGGTGRDQATFLLEVGVLF